MNLSLFVYGSLRPGMNNYDQLSHAVTGSQSVIWPGFLRLRPEGYPALTLPEEWPRRECLPYQWEAPAELAPPTPQLECNVVGEILQLRDSPELRRHLDDFEGFTPELNDYLRVACAWQGTWVWTYIAPCDRSDWPLIQRWPHHSGDIPPWR
ncbi:gamma-glutamylcyclotransferase [bacterium]|nr:gamma-glutamylcyclotransferase [bacterium]